MKAVIHITTETEVKAALMTAVESNATLAVTIPKEHIENLDIRYALLHLNSAKSLLKAKKIKPNSLKMTLTVHGYDDDPRGLWEIKEVRQWVARFIQKTHWDIKPFDNATHEWLQLCSTRRVI